VASKPKETKLSYELGQLELFAGTSFTGRLLDSDIIINLQRAAAPAGRNLPEEKDDYTRADVFVRDLGRREPLAVSYVSLFEVIDPRRAPKSDPNRPLDPLSVAERARMYEHLELLKQYNIRVIGMDEEIFSLAMDVWFESRQGRFGNIRDTALLDPMIAATAIVRGMEFLTVNSKHFEPFRNHYGSSFKLREVAESGGYLKLKTP